MAKGALYIWFDATILELGRQLRWSFLPPLMVYFAAGLSGATAIVGTFFVKDYLGLSAAFLSGIAFWAGLPWAMKMPLGHLVDLMWRWKSLLIYLGATLITASIAIMYALLMLPDDMAAVMAPGAWYFLSALLAPLGYVLQDAVADAMSVEAVPIRAPDGRLLTDQESKSLHTTMQTLGRFVLISGLVTVAAVNIYMFGGIEQLSQEAKTTLYGKVYLIAFLIPVVSISGAVLGEVFSSRQRKTGFAPPDAKDQAAAPQDEKQAAVPDARYFIGGSVFLILAVTIGIADVPFSQEIVFLGSMGIVIYLMHRLLKEISPAKAQALVGTAIIIFVFRAVPLPGAGATWFEIDVLGFDQQFLSVLALIASLLTLAGMIVLRPVIARWRISSVIILLTIASSILFLPNVGLYYGLHHWTQQVTSGVVDARFIALIDTAFESPLGQIAMIPMLAWIAKNAPGHLKATFFAVMASFTNLALSASSLLTKHFNQVLVVTREVRDSKTGEVLVNADYGELGILLIGVGMIAFFAPLLTIFLVQRSRLRTED